MATLPAPTRPALNVRPFFENKSRAFWTLQAVGWTGYLLLRGASTLTNLSLDTIIPVIVEAIVGYCVTLLLSTFYGYFRRLPRISGLILTILAFVVATIFSTFVDAFTWSLIQNGQPGVTLPRMVVAFYVAFTALFGWSALYFGINFYLIVEDQIDQMQHLESQASSAQLAMLRYQLNPHFLFNTLNSISTLVLLKQTEQANAMLSRLSSFLRFTLINEAAAKVPLTQEVETLKLYLDIEKMRFEERLRTYFIIEPAVENALVPSLLLQPLVENAIKYAVTPKEEGADISVTAQLVGQRVRITVSDTGPGLQPGQQDHSLSTGVGMANTRERLSQAYGDDQRFEHYVKAGGGFEVLLELPYQSRIIAGEDNQTGAKQQGQISA